MAMINVETEPLVTPALMTLGGASLLFGVASWGTPAGKPLAILGVSALAVGGIRVLMEGGEGEEGPPEAEVHGLEVRYE